MNEKGINDTVVLSYPLLFPRAFFFIPLAFNSTHSQRISITHLFMLVRVTAVIASPHHFTSKSCLQRSNSITHDNPTFA